MSDIDRHLMEGETVTYRTRLHWRMLIVPVLVAVLLGAIGGMALLTPVPWLGLVPVAVGLAVLGSAAVRRASSEFVVTNRRILLRVGVLTIRSVEMLHGKIESVAVTQTLGGRLFGYGSIVVTGSGGSREVFDGIQAPFEFRNAVASSAEAAAGAGR